MRRCKWLTCRLGVPRGYMQGHGEAAGATWEDSKEWVGSGVGTTVRVGKGKAREVGKTEGKRKLRRARGGRERGDRERGRSKRRRRKREMDGWKTSLEERGTTRERREQREAWEHAEIDRGIGAWFTGGTHGWPIEGERHQELEKTDEPESATLGGSSGQNFVRWHRGWGLMHNPVRQGQRWCATPWEK